MTTIQVREHTRKKPDRIKNDPFRDLIEARKAILAARIKSREEWPAPSWRLPRVFRAISEALRAWRE